MDSKDRVSIEKRWQRRGIRFWSNGYLEAKHYNVREETARRKLLRKMSPISGKRELPRKR